MPVHLEISSAMSFVGHLLARSSPACSQSLLASLYSCFQPQPFRLEFGRLLVVLPLRGRFLFVGQLLDALLQRLDLRRRALGIDAQLAGRLVDQVDGLVRQVPVGDIALAQLGRRFQGLIGDLYLVMGFVPGPQPCSISMVSSTLGSPTKTGWKRRSRALSFSIYLRYSSSVVAPMHCSSPWASAGLSMLLASMAPSAAAGADDGMYLVDEQDDLTLGLA